MTEQAEIAKRLREARGYVGLSQEFVALRLGLHRSALSDIERGTRKVTAIELRGLAELYGRSVDDLIGVHVPEDHQIRALARVVGSLTDDDRAEVVRFAEFLRAKTTTGSGDH
jgi:transcriptional regulator with XRE-family HTH domain